MSNAMTDIVGNLRHKAALKNLSGWGAQSQLAMASAADEIERLRAALERARVHVLASSGAEHMMDGFGPRRERPSDALVAEIDQLLGDGGSTNMSELLTGLTAVVQYRSKDWAESYSQWRTMAAFDVPSAAESYCAQQAGNLPWEYRWLEIPEAPDTRGSKMTRDELIKIHGEGNCHICGKPKISEGLDICSYPHAMVPTKAVDPEHPEGFWEWHPGTGEEVR